MSRLDVQEESQETISEEQMKNIRRLQKNIPRLTTPKTRTRPEKDKSIIQRSPVKLGSNKQQPTRSTVVRGDEITTDSDYSSVIPDKKGRKGGAQKNSNDSSLHPGSQKQDKGVPNPRAESIVNRSESDGNQTKQTKCVALVPVAEDIASGMASALETFGLTSGARRLLESSLQTTIEIDAGAVINELQRMVSSPLEGVLEANRLGTLGQMYKSAEAVLTSLTNEIELMSIKSKIGFLEMLLGKIKALADVDLPRGGGRSSRSSDGYAELSQTKTIRVSLETRKEKRDTDRILGEEDRPPDDFLTDG